MLKESTTLEMESKHVDVLVLSGGAMKCIAQLGCLIKAKNITEITKFYGTSMGSIICYLLIIGYTPLELYNIVIDKKFEFGYSDIEFMKVITKFGLFSFKTKVKNVLIKLTKKRAKVNSFTLLELFEKYKKSLTCVTYNLTDAKTEYISHLNHPNMPCFKAIRMSSNVPILFFSCSYDDKIYVDGGLSDNYPLIKAIKENGVNDTEILGINVTSTTMKCNSIFSYIYNVIRIPFIELEKNRKSYELNENCTSVNIQVDDISIFDYNVEESEIRSLFALGIRAWDDI